MRWWIPSALVVIALAATVWLRVRERPFIEQSTLAVWILTALGLVFWNLRKAKNRLRIGRVGAAVEFGQGRLAVGIGVRSGIGGIGWVEGVKPDITNGNRSRGAGGADANSAPAAGPRRIRFGR